MSWYWCLLKHRNRKGSLSQYPRMCSWKRICMSKHRIIIFLLIFSVRHVRSSRDVMCFPRVEWCICRKKKKKKKRNANISSGASSKLTSHEQQNESWKQLSKGWLNWEVSWSFSSFLTYFDLTSLIRAIFIKVYWKSNSRWAKYSTWQSLVLFTSSRCVFNLSSHRIVFLQRTGLMEK